MRDFIQRYELFITLLLKRRRSSAYHVSPSSHSVRCNWPHTYRDSNSTGSAILLILWLACCHLRLARVGACASYQPAWHTFWWDHTNSRLAGCPAHCHTKEIREYTAVRITFCTAASWSKIVLCERRIAWRTFILVPNSTLDSFAVSRTETSYLNISRSSHCLLAFKCHLHSHATISWSRNWIGDAPAQRKEHLISDFSLS